MKETTKSDISLKIKHIIAEDLDVNIRLEDIADDASLYDDGLGLDSIAIVNFIVLVEKKFNISFGENDISTDLFSNIDVLAGFISGKIRAEDSSLA